MNRLTISAVVFAIAVLGTGSADAKAKPVTGTWTLTVEQLGMKFTLLQKKNTITGTLDWPHGDPFRLTGGFTGDTLTFAGDSRGENFTIRIDSTGRLQADGSMAGVIKAHFIDFNDAHEVVRQRDQEIPWTAVRGEHGIVHFPRWAVRCLAPYKSFIVDASVPDVLAMVYPWPGAAPVLFWSLQPEASYSPIPGSVGNRRFRHS